MAIFNQTISVDADDGLTIYQIGTGPFPGDAWRPQAAYASDGYYYVGRRTGASTRNDAGARFTNVTIGQGETINSATVTLTINGADGHDFSAFTITCDAHDVDNMPALADDPGVNPIENWVATTATGSITGPDVSAAGNTVVITITDVIQEIVDRVGWSSGNAIGLRFMVNLATTYLQIQFADVDNATYDPATISIDYGPSITSVSGDDTIGATETDWVIAGSGFGAA